MKSHHCMSYHPYFSSCKPILPPTLEIKSHHYFLFDNVTLILKNLKPSMYFIKSFSIIAHIFGICKVYNHHWFLIFIYVSQIWNLKSSTHLFTLNYSTSIFWLCYPHLEVLYQSLFFCYIN